MIEVTRVRTTHPWVRVHTVVFAADSVGIDPEGQPARVKRDVVVTAIVPARDGGYLVLLRPFRREDEAEGEGA